MELAKNPRHTFVCRGFFLCDRENSNSNDDDRSQRLKQGGVVGAAFWFFKALSRGCGKISKRNPSGPAQQGKHSARRAVA